MRACRFVATLELEIEAGTAAAMRDGAAAIEAIAGERLRQEWLRLLGQARQPSRGLAWMLRTGLLDRMMPELTESLGVTQNRHHRYDVLTHAFFACDHAPRERPLVRLAALLHDVAKPRTRAFRDDGEAMFHGHDRLGADLVRRLLARLRFSAAEIRIVADLVQHHMFQYERGWTDAAVRRFIRRVGEERLQDLFALRVADAAASGRDLATGSALAELRSRCAVLLADSEHGYPRRLAIDGRDVMSALCIEPGPRVGEVLARLDEVVLADPDRNTRASLLALLKTWQAADNNPKSIPDR
jgi:tRNA nucleotidyltransferase (CCA-adding enzyme)